MINGISRNAAVDGANAAMPGTPGFAEDYILVFGVADLADGGVAILVEAANFAGGQANHGVAFVAGHQRGRATGAADHLRALSGNDLEIVNGQADGDGTKRQAVTEFGWSGGTAHQLGADLETDGSNDVNFFAVLVF